VFCNEFVVERVNNGIEVRCDLDGWNVPFPDEELLRQAMIMGLNCAAFRLAKMPWLDEKTRKLLETDLTDSESVV